MCNLPAKGNVDVENAKSKNKAWNVLQLKFMWMLVVCLALSPSIVAAVANNNIFNKRHAAATLHKMLPNQPDIDCMGRR